MTVARREEDTASTKEFFNAFSDPDFVLYNGNLHSVPHVVAATYPDRNETGRRIIVRFTASKAKVRFKIPEAHFETHFNPSPHHIHGMIITYFQTNFHPYLRKNRAMLTAH
jgi:hypothetical protein